MNPLPKQNTSMNLPHIPRFPILPTVTTSLVAIAVITGLILAGSPAEERLRRFDQQRISNLQQIQNVVIETYVAQFDHLPATLDEAMKRSPASPDIYTDPETHQFYAYQPLSTETYQLCATFSLPSNSQTDSVSPMWEHGSGYSCFTLQIPSKQRAETPTFNQMK